MQLTWMKAPFAPAAGSPMRQSIGSGSGNTTILSTSRLQHSVCTATLRPAGTLDQGPGTTFWLQGSSHVRLHHIPVEFGDASGGCYETDMRHRRVGTAAIFILPLHGVGHRVCRKPPSFSVRASGETLKLIWSTHDQQRLQGRSSSCGQPCHC